MKGCLRKLDALGLHGQMRNKECHKPQVGDGRPNIHACQGVPASASQSKAGTICQV